jgi:hypothetical protein
MPGAAHQRADDGTSRVVESGTVWVRRDCLVYDRGPYHWTPQCVEGRALVRVDRAAAEAMSNLRPCKLCMTRSRRRVYP